MKPPQRSSTTFEKVKIGDFITGYISKIEYDNEHKFKGFEGKEDKISPAIRFVFKLDGYEYPHRSRWMNFNVGEKSNLYKKYISKLVANAKPDMSFDLDILLDMQVKTIWEENGDFQNLENIYPAGKKITIKDEDEGDDFTHEPDDDDVPL
jgi:hypothetical protein